MPVKASELVALLCDHIKEHGDNHVMIYDDYLSIYKTISKRNISRMPGKKFVIECTDDSGKKR